MGYKKVDKAISFAEVALLRSMENNRSVEMMERINKAVAWENVEALLREYYPIGQSYEGADAYHPLMLLKCMLLQKWFHIPSDPELENQINDRISFKKFLGFSLLMALDMLPDRSVGRVAMEKNGRTIIKQLEHYRRARLNISDRVS